MKFIKALAIVIWTALGFYFGIGGYMSIILLEEKETWQILPKDELQIDDIVYHNIEQYRWATNKQQMEDLFTWLIDVPQSLAIIITALSFGVLGGVTRLIKQHAFEEGKTLDNLQVFSIPTLGMLSGIIMLGISFIIPTLLTTGDQELRPTTLVFLTLFAGLFAKRFYEWLNSSFSIIFPQPKS